MTMDQTEDGSFDVTNAGYLGSTGGSFSASKGSSFVMHYHTEKGEDKPGKNDHNPVHEINTPNVTVTYNTRTKRVAIYEVGRNNGLYKYRRIKPNSSTGPWKENKKWNKK